MKPQVVILGSGGWMPSKNRQTCSALFRWDNKALLLDAGTGVSLLQDKSILEGVDELALILTHFHLDHICGMAYFPGVLPFPPVVYAPAKLLYGASSQSIIKRFILSPYHPVALEDTLSEIQELKEDNNILGAGVRVRKQIRHSMATAALRVEDRFTYLTDTAFDRKNIDFSRGVSTIFHEAWCAGGKDRWDSHSSGADAGRLALEAGAQSLYLIHNNPFAEEESVLVEAQREFPETHLTFDGQVVRV